MNFFLSLEKSSIVYFISCDFCSSYLNEKIDYPFIIWIACTNRKKKNVCFYPKMLLRVGIVSPFLPCFIELKVDYIGCLSQGVFLRNTLFDNSLMQHLKRKIANKRSPINEEEKEECFRRITEHRMNLEVVKFRHEQLHVQWLKRFYRIRKTDQLGEEKS